MNSLNVTYLSEKERENFETGLSQDLKPEQQENLTKILRYTQN